MSDQLVYICLKCNRILEDTEVVNTNFHSCCPNCTCIPNFEHSYHDFYKDETTTHKVRRTSLIDLVNRILHTNELLLRKGKGIDLGGI